MAHRRGDKPHTWEAMFQPGKIERFDTDDEFRAAGVRHKRKNVVDQAIQIVSQRAQHAALRQRIAEHAQGQGIKPDSLKTLKAVLQPEAAGDLTHVAMLFTQLNCLAPPSVTLAPGCHNLDPPFDKNVVSVYVVGGLVLFPQRDCTAPDNEAPRIISSPPNGDIQVDDLDVWKNVASSCYSW